MRCSSCQAVNPQAARFCQQCGTRLSRVCRRCGSELLDAARFCHQCGESTSATITDNATKGRPTPRDYTPRHLAERVLRQRSALEGERKQVTVLFVDVKGSMELAETVELEAWHRILDRFFALLSAGVHRFEGTVNQYTGDGIMALFGAPVAHEDHALRACSAALYLQQELKRYTHRLRLEQGLNFGVRLGLNSGEVVVGRIGDDLRMDYTAKGQTVGLAARMEQLAESGQIYLTERTARLVEGRFELRDLGDTEVRGVSGRLRIYELLGAGPLTTRLDVARARGLTPLVGRDGEVATLEAALVRAGDGQGGVVGLLGDAGVGKSRVCLELLERARARGFVTYEAHCPSHGRAVPLLPILQLLRQLFGLAEEEPAAEARKKIAGTLVLLDDRFRDALGLWFDLLNVSDPEAPPTSEAESRRPFLAQFDRLLRNVVGREPAVFLIEDLHWIDAASEELLALLIEAAAGSRTLVLLNYRPGYRADWMHGTGYQVLPMPALGSAESGQLLDQLLGSDPSLSELSERLGERTRGNPFFIEEAVRALVEAGRLDGPPGAYRLAAPIVELPAEALLPATVEAVIAGRIDRLSDPAKQTLQGAAVIGMEVAVSVLRAVAELENAALEAALGELVEAELLRPRALFPEASYLFRHPLTQEVAYRSQLSAARAARHGRVAGAVIAAAGEASDERAGLIAHHWERAGERLEAVRWHRRAARKAGFADLKGALFHWREVRRLIPVEPPTAEERELMLDACRGALGMGGRVQIPPDEVRELFAAGLRLAEEIGDDAARARLHEELAARLGWAGDMDGQRRHLEEATRIMRQGGSTEVELSLQLRRFVAEFHRGDLRSALRLAEEGLTRCRAGGADRGSSPIAYLHRGLLLSQANALAQMAELARAEEVLERAAAVRTQANGGDTRTTHTAALVRSQLPLLRGEEQAALREAGAFVELAERSGSSWAGPVSRLALARALLLAERWDEARELLERSLRQARLSHLGLEAEASYVAAQAEAATGSGALDEACSTAEEAIAIGQRMGTCFWELYAQLAYAEAMLRRGESRHAARIEATLLHAQRLIEETGGEVLRPRLHLLRAALLELSGEAESGGEERSAAERLWERMGASGHLRRLRAG